MNKRDTEILEILAEAKKVDVVALSSRLHVSQVTIRKDLDRLEQRGLVLREHGYAVLRSQDDIRGRMAFHYEEKKKIAALALSLIREGETIMIESGSCCVCLAEAIVQHFSHVTIVTNSAFIADYLRSYRNADCVLLGGSYQNDAQVTVGPLVKQSARNYFVDKLFIGTDGYDQRIGFTNSDQYRAQAVRDMAEQAKQVIILTESAKFQQHGIVPFRLENQIKQIVTDAQLDPEIQKELETNGYTVLTA